MLLPPPKKKMLSHGHEFCTKTTSLLDKNVNFVFKLALQKETQLNGISAFYKLLHELQLLQLKCIYTLDYPV